MEKSEKLPPIHTLNANPETNVSHNELFNIAYNFSYFHNIKAVHIPKIIARMGIIFRQIKGTDTFLRQEGRSPRGYLFLASQASLHEYVRTLHNQAVCIRQ